MDESLFAYLSKFREMNMKDNSFFLNQQNINADRLFEILEQKHVLSLGMPPPFTSSNYKRKKRPGDIRARQDVVLTSA